MGWNETPKCWILACLGKDTLGNTTRIPEMLGRFFKFE